MLQETLLEIKRRIQALEARIKRLETNAPKPRARRKAPGPIALSTLIETLVRSVDDYWRDNGAPMPLRTASQRFASRFKAHETSLADTIASLASGGRFHVLDTIAHARYLFPKGPYEALTQADREAWRAYGSDPRHVERLRKSKKAIDKQAGETMKNMPSEEDLQKANDAAISYFRKKGILDEGNEGNGGSDKS